MSRLALILILAAPVLAQDFETSYHEAYKLEVVDGKVADAATRYLDLLREKDLPPHLKAQAEFRFAVTCALLGRPDEARARLAALAVAEGTPLALKPEIDEYRKSLAEVEPGSAAAKRIEELVFQLGRAGPDPYQPAPVYRDFEIMGAAAVPHLRKLLEHPDQQLREHAFRILCRMNQPGLGALWDPKWTSTVYDFAQYLERHEDGRAALEKRLLDMPPASTDVILGVSSAGAWSAAFLKQHAERGGSRDNVARAVAARPDEEERHKMLAAWLTDGPDDLGDAAADSVAAWLGRGPYRKRFDARLFPAVGFRFARPMPMSEPQRNSIIAAAAEQPTGALLDLWARVLDRPGGALIAAVVAQQLAARATDEAETQQLGPLLLASIAKGALSSGDVRAYSLRLPADMAAALVRKYFAGIAEIPQSWHLSAIALERPEDIPLFCAALDGMNPGYRYRVFHQIFSDADRRPQTSPETRLAMARLLPTLSNMIETADLASWVRRLAPRLPPEEAIAQVVELVRRDSPSVNACTALYRVDVDHPEDGLYRRNVAIPALPQVWELSPNGTLIVWSLQMLDAGGPLALGEERSRELAAFLLPRLDAMSQGSVGWSIVVSHPDLFPLEAWLPNSPEYLWSSSPNLFDANDRARLDAAARALVADPSKVTGTVLRVLETRVSPDVRAECAAQLYRKADVNLLPMLLARRGLMPSDSAVLEETYDRLSDADLGVVAQLGFRLADVRPSEKLYGLAERLLASPDRGFILQGIALAQSLGRDALVPYLLKQLDSMDVEVRTKARVAIDSILELKRIKDEVAQRIAEQKK